MVAHARVFGYTPPLRTLTSFDGWRLVRRTEASACGLAAASLHIIKSQSGANDAALIIAADTVLWISPRLAC